jgi:prolyl oligopeptidase
MPLSTPTLVPVEKLIHGVKVRDPYRWLEDRDLPETEQWIRNQRERFEDYFAGCPDLDAI